VTHYGVSSDSKTEGHATYITSIYYEDIVICIFHAFFLGERYKCKLYLHKMFTRLLTQVPVVKWSTRKRRNVPRPKPSVPVLNQKV